MKVYTLNEWNNRKKKKDEKANESAGLKVYSYDEWADKKGIQPITSSKNKKDDDIAPVRMTTTVSDIAPVNGGGMRRGEEDATKERKWFEKGAFSDGYQFGDITKTILGTIRDADNNFTSGILGMGEKVVDALAYLAPAASQAAQAQNNPYYQFDIGQYRKDQESAQEFIQKDLYDEEELAKKVNLTNLGNIAKTLGIDGDKNSVLGEKSDSLVQSAGQLTATALLNPVVPWYVTSGVTSFGSELESSFGEGASFDEAGGSALISAGAEILSEKLGGISFGGKTVTDTMLKPLTGQISNKVMKHLVNFGINGAAEGAEEVFSSVVSRLGTKLYKEENLDEILGSEEALDEYLESFIGGFALGGVASAGGAISAELSGRDFVTGMTNNEKAVVDKVYNDAVAEREADGTKLTQREKNKLYDATVKAMERGNIDIDTIESVLGGDTYNSYKEATDNEESLKREYEALGNVTQPTLAQQSRYAQLEKQMEELKTNSNSSQIKEQLSREVSEMALSDRLSESYRQREMKSRVFEADLTKYDTKQQEVVKRAVESGILNNTNRTHDFVDMIAKISAEKGVSFDFTNNQKLKESGFAIDGKSINGFVKDGNVSLNIDSAKSLNAVVGHEITHVLEGTELYTELQNAVKEFATAKGEYDTRLASISKVYEGVKGANVEAELTADLVGDYLFTDSEFISKLSTEKPGIFKKIFEEIKYLCKVATAGSKEARELEKVKRAFEKAYREGGTESAESDGDVQYSVAVTDQNTIDFLENQEHIVTYKAMQLIDGKLYPPMAGKVKNEKGKYVLTNPGQLGVWQQATEDPKNIKEFKNGVGYYELKKTEGGSPVKAAYNPYEHSSNLVLNDQFESAYKRDNLVTVEGVIPVSEMTSGYKAEYAKDSTGVMDWHSGLVASKLKDNKRQVYLSRYFKPVRVLSDSEVASKYKEILDGQGVPVPFNVVSPSLLAELEKAGVEIDYEGTPGYQYHAKKAAEKTKYSLTDSDGKQLTKEQQNFFKDSKVRDENGNLKPLYHGTESMAFTEFNVENGAWLSETMAYADVYAGNWHSWRDDYEEAPTRSDINGLEKEVYADEDLRIYKLYADIKNPFDIGEINGTLSEGKVSDLANKLGHYVADQTGDMSQGGKTAMEVRKLAKNYIGEKAYNFTRTKEFIDYVKQLGFDGFKATEGGRNTYCVFNTADQLKLTTNENPTSDADIRYSLSEDTDGRKLSEKQKEYFKNSKVVDDNGKLKVMYHGTADDFTVFNPFLKGGKNGTAEGYGIYFADTKLVSDAYGGKTMSGYLNITRPATSYDKTIKKSELVKLIKTTCEAEAQRFVDDGDYDNIKDALKDTWISDYVYTYDIPISEAYRQVADSILSSNDSDMDIVQEVMNGNGIRDYESAYKFYDVLKSTLGIDGFITEWENQNVDVYSKIAIAFDSNQFKNVDNLNPTDNPDIRHDLSSGKRKTYGNYNVYGKDIALKQDIAPVEEPAPQNQRSEVTMVDDYAPLTEMEVNEHNARMEQEHYFLDDIAPEAEEIYNGEFADHVKPADPFYEKDIVEAGRNRSQKAYMYENPEVKPFFQEEARYMLGELNNSQKGEKLYNDDLYYETNGEMGFFGTKRHTSDDIAYLLDTFGYTYKQIAKGLNDIIEDNGKENNAVSKRIEFLLDERLRTGYTDFWFGDEVPPNQEYINLLNEKQITEYDDEAWNNWLQGLTEEDLNNLSATYSMGESEPPQDYMAVEQAKPKKQPKKVNPKPVVDDAPVARILTEEPEAEKKKSRFLTQAMELTLDKGFVFENLSKKTKNRELEAKWNYIRYADGKAQDFIGKGAEGVRALNDLRKEVDGAGLTEKLYEYVYHLHNADRMTLANRYENTENKPVFGESVTADASKTAVAQLEAQYPELKKYANEIYSINNYLRGLLVDGGVISQETADLWAEMYPHYVPIRRAGDHGLNVNVPLDTGRTGVNAPVKRATGGSSDILPLFDTMAQRALQTYKAVAKNRFGVELKNTLGTTIEAETADVDSIIDGIDQNEELLQKGKNGKKPTFTVFENGERVTFEITEDMYDALKPTNEMLAHTIKPLNKAMSLHRGVLTEYNPAFMASNIIKDVQDVLINSQHSAKTYGNFPKAIKEMTTKGKWYQEYLKNGGEQDTYFDKQENTFQKEMSKLEKVVGAPFRGISKANNFIERLPRLAEYIASRESGRSIEVSMLDSARVTTNFAAGGDLTKFANRNGATFLNASVQGVMQQVRNVREAKMNGLKGVVQLAAKYTVAGLPVVLLNSLMWDDDEEYEELSDYVKQNYYVVAKYGDGKFIRIPKGRMLAVIQNGFEQMKNLATGDDEADLKEFLKFAVGNLAPNNPVEDNIIAPIIQQAKNTTWYDGDLVPTRLQDLPAEEQYDESIDEISKWLGEKLHYSPYKINYMLDQYSGGVGDSLLPLITPEAETGDDTAIAKITAPVRDKFVTDSVLKNQNVSDFYDKADELTTNAKSSRATDTDILSNKYFNSKSTEIGNLYKEKREIQSRDDLSDSEKYYLVRELQKKINNLAKEALNDYSGVNIEGPYSTVGDKQYRQTEDGWTKITDDQAEKQEKVTSTLGITPAEYWGNKDEYNYAYDNPEKYAVSKAVGGYDAYKQYSKELYDIKSDKDANGKSIAGSRKEKVIEYINNLDADYGTKIILIKSEYNADDTYNDDIVDYLNSKADLTYEDITAILEELGAKVKSDGTVIW